MNIYHNIHNLNVNNVTFSNAIANKFSNYEKFYKIIYNVNGMTLNSIFLLVDIDYLNVVEDNKKNKITFNIDEKTIDKIKKMETLILENINQYLQKDIVSSCTHNLVNHKCIYTMNTISKKNKKIYIRISGVWESNNQIGLTTKLTLVE